MPLRQRVYSGAVIANFLKQSPAHEAESRTGEAIHFNLIVFKEKTIRISIAIGARV